MSDTRIDMTAWDPRDPEVAAQVNAELAQRRTVARKNSALTSGILKNANTIVFVFALVVCMLVFGFNLSPGWLVTIVIPYLIFWTLRANQNSQHLMTPREITQEVRLSEMARRNEAKMRPSPDPEGGTPDNSPLLPDGGSILSMGDSVSLNPAFTSTSGTPEQWGNILVDEGKRTSFEAWYLMIDLGRPVPHILLNAAGSHLPVAVDKGQQVHLNAKFDEVFTTYIPVGTQNNVSDFLTDNVRRSLMARAAGLDVEFVGTDVIFFESHRAHWNTAAAWEKVRELRYQTDLITFPESPAPAGTMWRVVRKPVRTPRLNIPTTDKALVGGILLLTLVVVLFNLIRSL